MCADFQLGSCKFGTGPSMIIPIIDCRIPYIQLSRGLASSAAIEIHAPSGCESCVLHYFKICTELRNDFQAKQIMVDDVGYLEE